MNSEDKLIITAAITGTVHIPSQSPYLPYQPDHIVEEAVLAHQAGAAIVHIHVRDPENGKPSSDIKLYRYIMEQIKARCNVIICITTGGALGQPIEQRVRVINEFKPELASLNMGSMNFALYPAKDKIQKYKYEWEQDYLTFSENTIFANTFKDMKYICKKMRENNTVPELEIYDIGMINNAAQLVREGFLQEPLYLQFVLGILGGIPASVENLVYMVNSARSHFKSFRWSVCAAGRFQLMMGAAALAMGGNTRVGLEDSIYLRKGVLAKSNSEQVKSIIGIANYLSREITTSNEARLLLNLKGAEQTNF